MTRAGCETPDQTVDFNVGISRGGYSLSIPCRIKIRSIPHNVPEWTVTRQATELAAGSKEGVCSECGNTVTKTIKKLSPTLSAVQIEKIVKSTKASLNKSGKRAAIVRWKKLSSKKRNSIKKIQIQCSTDKTFSKNVRTFYRDAGKTSKTIKNLKKGTRYYFRIRSYTKSGSGTESGSAAESGSAVHVAKWSSWKSIKIS